YVRSRVGPIRATPDSLPKRLRQTLLKDVEGLPAHLERLLIAIETLSEQIADADTELKELALEDERMSRHDGSRCRSSDGRSIRCRHRPRRAVPECIKRRVVSRPDSERRYHRLSHQTETTDKGWCPAGSLGAGPSRLVVVSSPPSRPNVQWAKRIAE